MKRLFAAVKVHPDENLLQIYQEIRKMLRNDTINWVDERNIHITLKFFGDTHEDDIPTISDVLRRTAGRHQPFEMSLESVGIFGSSYNPRVIWFGLRRSQPVEKLAEDVLDSLAKSGFPRDEQHFRPHLTIGRVKSVDNKKYFQQIIDRYKQTYLQEVPVRNFELIESKLTPRGPIYTSLETFPLG